VDFIGRAEVIAAVQGQSTAVSGSTSRADQRRGSRRRRQDLRLGRGRLAGFRVLRGGGGVSPTLDGPYPAVAEGPGSIHGAQSLIEVITAIVRASLAWRPLATARLIGGDSGLGDCLLVGILQDTVVGGARRILCLSKVRV
jgi:hypothetical protein